MKFLRIFVLILVILTLAASAHATDYNVSTVNDLESKVNSANNNDTIIVAAGDYTLNNTLTISKSITLKSSGTVTLDGQNVRRVIKITGGSPTIEGFTIKNGNAGDGELTGGGIEANGDDLIVTNCRFENNEAANNGGGIYVYKKAEIKNCTFINNKADANSDECGGGIFVNDNARVEITNCTFTGNTAKDTKSGGLCVAGYAGSGSTNVTVNYCTFATASDKILMNKENTFVVKNSIIREIVAGNDASLSKITTSNNLTITTTLTAENVKDSTGKVTHTVFRKESELSSAVDNGDDTTVTTDQLGNTLTGKHDIGAVEIAVKRLQNVTVNFTSAPTALTVTQGTTAATAAFKATATANYNDNSTTALTPTLSLESNYEWITFNASTGIVTAKPTASVNAGNYSVKIKASAASEGVTQTAETTLTVTVVNASVTITPKSLTFDKASITLNFDVDRAASVSESVIVTVKDTNGNDITALGEIVCEKQSDVEGLTSAVDGKKITFTALAEKVSGSKTAGFTVTFRYNGKNYLKTSYKVELLITKLMKYSLTLSPVEITVIPGSTASFDLKNSVKFEKVFLNNNRQTVSDAKMKFSLNNADSWIKCDVNSGVVTFTPGADVENGVLKYRYGVEAEYDGNSELEVADFIVNVVKQSPAITTAKLPTAMTGNAYSQTLSATGEAPIKWTKTGGELPDGLTLNESTGEISGTPADSGGGKTFKFTVQASNAYGTDSREFSITVILTKSVVPGTWKYTLSKKEGMYLKPGQTFYYKRRVAKGENINYTYDKKYVPSGTYLKSVFVWDASDGAVKEGESYIKFTLNYKGKTHDYVFKDAAIRAKNSYGESYSSEKTITVTKNEKNDNGKISLSAHDSEVGLITIAEEEDEEFSGTMYFDDGGTDEDGNITGVIGGDNAKFNTLADFINSLTEEQYTKVIRLEFRKGAEISKITSADIAKLTGLFEIAVNESETLKEIDLNGNKNLESVSIFNCPLLEKLNVNGCASIYHFEAAQCPKLTELDINGCSSLETLWLNGSSITNLNLGGSDFANVSDIDLTECNSLTSLNVEGCTALSNLYAPYTAVTELKLTNNTELTELFLNGTKIETLDLSNNAKLKSLSLVGATELSALKLAKGVELEEFEITASRITELDYSGNTNITSLDLSSNTALKTLNLTNCTNLKELTITGTPIEKLTLAGCSSLEKIEAEGCTELASLNAKDCSLKWLNVTGCTKLAELDCSDNQLGWLNLDGLNALSKVNYSGQKINGWVPDTRMKMSDYIGSNDIGRIVDILAYGAGGTGIGMTIEDVNGNVYKADTEYYARFEEVPEKVVYYYDTSYNGEPMDVTLGAGSSSDSPSDNPTNIGSSGGGCNSVSGVLTLIPFLRFSKKKKEK